MCWSGLVPGVGVGGGVVEVVPCDGVALSGDDTVGGVFV